MEKLGNETQKIFVNGQLLPYEEKTQKHFDLITQLCNCGIISEKEFYILKHRIIKIVAENFNKEIDLEKYLNSKEVHTDTIR